MALHQGSFDYQAVSRQDVVRAVVIFAVVIALMLVATAVLGMQGTGPSYEIVPDPAGVSLPF